MSEREELRSSIIQVLIRTCYMNNLEDGIKEYKNNKYFYNLINNIDSYIEKMIDDFVYCENAKAYQQGYDRGFNASKKGTYQNEMIVIKDEASYIPEDVLNKIMNKREDKK